MKKFFLTLAAIIAFVGVAAAQNPMMKATNPATWSASVAMNDDGKTGTLTLTADIAPGWHVYGLDIPEGGPNATTINFDGTSKCINFTSDLKAVTPPKKEMDDVFEIELSWWEGKAVFTRDFALACDAQPAPVACAKEAPKCPKAMNACDKAEKCDKAPKCDKAQACPKEAPKCEKAHKCDKAMKACDKAEKCDKAPKCDKAQACPKEAPKCDKAHKCDKAMNACDKAEKCDKAQACPKEAPKCPKAMNACQKAPKCEAPQAKECKIVTNINFMACNNASCMPPRTDTVTVVVK